jgi:hypothetical protein
MMMLVLVLIIVSVILNKFDVTLGNGLLTAIVGYDEVKVILA